MDDAAEVGRPSRVPGHSRIWIRVGGAWRAGDVHRWILGVDPPTWLAWTSHAHPKGYGHPTWGLFVYDPATIRQRFCRLTMNQVCLSSSRDG